MGVNFGQRGKAEVGQARDLADLDLVHAAVAAQQQQPDLRLDDHARRVTLVGSHHQRFERTLQRQAQVFGYIHASTFPWRRYFGHSCYGRGARANRRQRFGFFHIGGVVAAGGIDDGVFTGGGYHLELFAQIASNGSAVGGHGAVGEAKTVKNAAVSLRHHLVAGFGRSHIPIKAVRVFHGELAPTQQTKAGAALVAELGLNLVEILGQLFVAFDFLAGNVGHDLFAGGLHHKIAVVAVFDAQQLGAHLVKAACFLPKLGGLHHRHAQFDGASPVHLFAHDGLDLADHPQAHGHVAVDARAKFFHHPGTHHQLVARHFGVGWGLFERGDQELGSFHASTRKTGRHCGAAGQPRNGGLPCIMAQV